MGKDARVSRWETTTGDLELRPVAALGQHARAGGQGQPVAVAPAQRSRDRPVGDPAGSVDAAQAVHHVRGQDEHLPG